MKPDIQENLMHRYLLGDLPEPQASALEREIFADDEKFEQMWEVENMLVDSYVRDRLSPEDRERFERHYLASPVHRRRVAASRSLLREADRSGPVATEAGPRLSLWSWLAERLGSSGGHWQLAAAAAMLLLVVGGVWLLVDRARLQAEIDQLRAGAQAQQGRSEEAADQVAAAQSQNDKLRAELEQLRAERDALAQKAAEQPQAQEERPSVLAFTLSPVLVRGSDAQTLRIPPGTDLVRLRMGVEQQDARRFQVIIRTDAGRQVWRQDSIKPHNGSAGAAITINIPASRLALGDYILTLSAVNETGEPEEVNRYFLRVTRQ